MDDEERKLFSALSREIITLFADRNDLLDLYRTLIAAGLDTKENAALRLRTQIDQLNTSVNGAGTRSLTWIADSLETEKLDAAKLLRDPVSGSA